MANIIEIVQPTGIEVIEIVVPGIQGPGPTQAQVDSAIATVGTADNTANTLVRRDAGGNAKFGRVYALTPTPANNDELTRKDYVDGIGTNLATANTIVRRDASGNTVINRLTVQQAPVGVGEVTRKDYVDGEVIKAIFRAQYGNSPWSIGNAEPFPRPSNQVTHSNDFVTFSCFTAPVANTITKLSIPIEAAGSGITWFQLALYTIGSDGRLTLTARTANTPSAAQVNGVASLPFDTTGGFPASFTFAPGQRYAFALRCMGSTIFASQAYFLYTGTNYEPFIGQRFYLGATTGMPTGTFYSNGSWWNAPYIVGLA